MKCLRRYVLADARCVQGCKHGLAVDSENEVRASSAGGEQPGRAVRGLMYSSSAVIIIHTLDTEVKAYLEKA